MKVTIRVSLLECSKRSASVPHAGQLGMRDQNKNHGTWELTPI